MVNSIHKCQQHEFDLDFPLVGTAEIHFVPILLLGLNFRIDVLKWCLWRNFHQMRSFTDSNFYFYVEIRDIFDNQFIDFCLGFKEIGEFYSELLIDQQMNNLWPIFVRKALY